MQNMQSQSCSESCQQQTLEFVKRMARPRQQILAWLCRTAGIQMRFKEGIRGCTWRVVMPYLFKGKAAMSPIAYTSGLLVRRWPSTCAVAFPLQDHFDNTATFRMKQTGSKATVQSPLKAERTGSNAFARWLDSTTLYFRQLYNLPCADIK